MKRMIACAVLALLALSATAQTLGQREIVFGTDLKAEAVVKRAKTLAKQLSDPKATNWRARGDQRRTYCFPEAKEFFPYRVCVPDAWDGVSPLPMVVFLHGGWNDESSYLDQNDKQLVKIANRYGVLLVSPLGGHAAYGNYMHLPAKFDRVDDMNKILAELQPDRIAANNLSEQDVINVIELVLAEYPVNRKEMFLMGHSMGSGGTWYLGAKYPGYWRALIPISGPFTMKDGYPWGRLKDKPIFMTEGLKAGASLESSRQLYQFAKDELKLNIQYKEVDGDHGGMFPMVLEECFLFMRKQCENIHPSKNFCIAKDGKAATIVVDGNDWKGVLRAANDLSDDVRKVTGVRSEVTVANNLQSSIFNPQSIIVGTIGKSKLIDRLIKQKKIDVKEVKGQWESYLIDVVDGNLIIAGSDKRGTIYGIYDISERIGVSPWYWMADAPVKHQDEVYYDGERFVQPSPKVKYRGIFINDEWPSFGGWCQKHFGGVNAKAYEHIFELLLRLKANYFWPAMWATAFNEDDPESPRLADEMGIVMGTSHHEPMMRSHQEYLRRKEQVGPWDYATNKERVDQFFREGMERNKAYDNLVTIGMRGDGDVAMGSGDDAENMKTLGKVIEGQRKIIKDIYGRPDAVPQLWAIFTEVQRYYDAGFTVPDDVTLLLCDNNWGYIRRKGRDFERRRKGGLGLYYHIDMNGGPWNDRWVNTTTIPKLREQLYLAYASGIDRIWIINVGDLKPKEVPIDFIMRYAWNPDAIQPGDEQAWLENFCGNIFGESFAKETADIIAKYSKYNLWRKPEAQVPGIYNMEEMLRIEKLWQSLVVRCEALKEQIPAEAQDAFYQLVYYPTVASAGVAQIYNSATLGDSLTINHLMAKDQRLTDYYNKGIAGGKWDGMMQDNHIGYTKWSIPDKNYHPMALGFKVEHNLRPSADTKEYSIPAHKYVRKGDAWIFLSDLGRGEGCMGAKDVMKEWSADGSGPALEYEIELDDNGHIAIGILPTQDILPARGLRLGIQLDDQPVQVIDARRGIVDTFSEYTPQNLAVSKVLKPLPPRSRLSLSGYVNGRQLPRRDEVFDNLRWLDTTFNSTPGRHTLKLIMIDPEIVIEQIVVNPDNNHYSYFGNIK